MKKRSVGACLAVAAAFLVGCGNSSSTSATPAVLINGNYEGVVVDSLDGEGLEVLGAFLDQLRRRGGAALWCAPETTQALLLPDTALRLAGGRLEPV